MWSKLALKCLHSDIDTHFFRIYDCPNNFFKSKTDKEGSSRYKHCPLYVNGYFWIYRQWAATAYRNFAIPR